MNHSGNSAWRRLRSSPLAMISLGIVLLYVFAAAGTELYTIWCEHCDQIPIYNLADDAMRYAPPSPLHWLGTDYQGRDVLLRAIAGSATAVKVGVIASLISAVIGVLLGAIAGFFGGKFDKLDYFPVLRILREVDCCTYADRKNHDKCGDHDIKSVHYIGKDADSMLEVTRACRNKRPCDLRQSLVENIEYHEKREG